MKIISNIKPRKLAVRRVTVNDTLYTFVAGPGGEYVADVTIPGDVETFLRSPHFRRADGKPLLQQPEQGESSSITDQPGEDDANHAPDATVNQEAETLLANTAADIGRELGGVSSLAVVERAIVLEAKGKDRAGVHTLLTKTLEGARQAGVA